MKTELSCRETCPFYSRRVVRPVSDGEPVMAESAPAKRPCGTKFNEGEMPCWDTVAEVSYRGQISGNVDEGLIETVGDKILFIETLPREGRIIATIEDGILAINQ